ncbi:MAG: DNA mismatch repair protein MutS, partial [Clostridia bacterium]
IAYQSIHGRDCLALCASFARIPSIVSLLEEFSAPLLQAVRCKLDPLEDVTDVLERMIHPDAPISMTEGGIIRDGYSEELDRLRNASSDGKQWIVTLEAREREETGIKNLRIHYNRVFGFYIEVTKSNYAQVPYRYTRKQTLTNCERYTTPELHELEKTILGAEEKAIRLEQELFNALRERLTAEIPRMQATAQAVKTLDALLSLALAAMENDYVRPTLNETGILHIENGRHPVVERTRKEAAFVPNDTDMDLQDNRMLIVTGP